jgi:hypothetical protein
MVNSAFRITRRDVGDAAWNASITYTIDVTSRNNGVDASNYEEMLAKSRRLLGSGEVDVEDVKAAMLLRQMIEEGVTNRFVSRDATSSFGQIAALIVGCRDSAEITNAVYLGGVPKDLWAIIASCVQSKFSYLKNLTPIQMRKVVKKPGTPMAYQAGTKSASKSLMGCGTNPQKFDDLIQSDTEVFTEAYSPLLDPMKEYLITCGRPVDNRNISAECVKISEAVQTELFANLPCLKAYNSNAKRCSQQARENGVLPLPMKGIGGHMLVEPEWVRSKKTDEDGKIVTVPVVVTVYHRRGNGTMRKQKVNRKMIPLVRNESDLRRAPKKTQKTEATGQHNETLECSDLEHLGCSTHDERKQLAPLCPEQDLRVAQCLHRSAMQTRAETAAESKTLGVPFQYNKNAIDANEVVRVNF